MFNRIRINRRILIAAVVVVVLFVIAGVCKAMIGHYVNIRSQHLNTYSYSSGGGMNGAYHEESVKRYGDGALIRIETAQWYAQDPTVTEYLTDAAVLDELEAVIRRHRMNFWHNKEFTRMFVYDGETESYHFGFDEECISFHSQIYPLRYARKLAELDRIVDKYIAVGEKLPGLVNQRTDEEELYYLPEGELEIYVYAYTENALRLRILNGTDEEVQIPETYTLINADTGAVLLEEDTPYGGRFSENTRDEMYLRLQERLPAGNYRIIFGDMDIPFEIR